MSKYCPMCDAVTNCTDNCTQCLKEAEREMIKVGSRIKYIREDTFDDKESGFYPPIGTCGTVVSVGSNTDIQVKWDDGTNGDGVWWCEITDVEAIEMNEAEILAQIMLEAEECVEISFNDVCAIAELVIALGYTRKEERKCP